LQELQKQQNLQLMLKDSPAKVVSEALYPFAISHEEAMLTDLLVVIVA
jgi:hypothetical protein